MLFLKIISFPVRFILFVFLALIALVIWCMNNSVGIFLQIGSAIISFLGMIFTFLTLIGLIIATVSMYKNGQSFHDTAVTCLTALGAIAVFGSACIFMPVISAYLYAGLAAFNNRLWALSKVVLLCDTDQFYLT